MMTLQGASCSQGHLGASTQACHTALFGTAPPTPQPHTPQHLHPQLPCSAGPFGITGEQMYLVSCFTHCTPARARLHLQEALAALAVGFVLGQITVLTGTPQYSSKVDLSSSCSDVIAITASTESKWQTKCLCIPRFFKCSLLPFAFWHNAIDSTQQARLFNYHNTT